MIRVLVVDDDEEWRGLIADALPEYRVDAAGSYREALDQLRQGIPYDVAIVDLNLVTRRQESVVDQLGKKFLAHLRDNHPAIPRIAVTGAPAGKVRGLIEEYGLAELLLKRSMRLAEVGEAVEEALDSVAGAVPLELRAERGDRWDEFSEWRDSIRHRIERKAKRLGSEPGKPGMAAGPGRDAGGAQDALATFESDCAGVATMLANVRNKAELDAAAREYTALRDRYHGVF